MAAKRPWFELPWDRASDQPAMLHDRALRRRLRARALPEIAVTLATTLAGLPFWALRYALQARTRPCRLAPQDFIGVAVDPRDDDPTHRRLTELVTELGAQRLQVRLHVGRPETWDASWSLVAALAPRPVLVVLCQDRACVCRPERWRAACEALFAGLPDNVEAVQVGNAVNRIKWGCAHVGEYLDLLEAAAAAWRAAPVGERLLLGSSIIDFEPPFTWRSLVNLRRFSLDATAALLYVDRRGAPRNRQYGIFDAERKIRVVAAAVGCSPRSANRLWLTEVNWPLQGSGEYAPTSSKEHVTEEEAAQYLADYYRIAYRTGLVERVYAWQLVARGYGLVDPTESNWRRRPAFTALQRLLAAPIAEGLLAPEDVV